VEHIQAASLKRSMSPLRTLARHLRHRARCLPGPLSPTAMALLRWSDSGRLANWPAHTLCLRLRHLLDATARCALWICFKLEQQCLASSLSKNS